MKVFQQLCLILTFCMLFETVALRPQKRIRKLNEEDYEDEEYPEDEEDYYDDEEYGDEEHHEEGEHHEEEGHHEGDDMIHFEDNSETEHLRNFKKISEDLKVYEDEYSECLKEIPNNEYTEETIEACVGKDFLKVMIDIKYETMKIFSRGDETIREIMIDRCYMEAEDDEVLGQACDLLERDILDMLWQSLHFEELMHANNVKYTENEGEMPKPLFKHIRENMIAFATEFFELVDEIHNHKEVTILRLKTLIDDRTKLIVAEARQHPEEVQPKRIQHTVEIEETIDQDNKLPQMDQLPSSQIVNADEQDFSTHPKTHNEEIGENVEGRRKLVLKRRQPQYIKPTPNHKLLPMHQKRQLIVRQKPNAYRVMNTEGSYRGLNQIGKNRKSSFRNQPQKRSLLQRLSLKNKITKSTFRSVHKAGNSRPQYREI